MKNFIKGNSTLKNVVILFILTNLIYVFMLTVTIQKVMLFSNEMKLLDMMPTGYDVEYVNKLLEVLGPQGRNSYLFYQLPLDMVYPLLFGITYSLLFAFVLKKLDGLKGFLYYFCFLPWFCTLFDYFENIGIISILLNFPNNPTTLTSVTNIFSILKSSFTTLFFTVLIISLIALVARNLIQTGTEVNQIKYKKKAS